jgi:hypothetical protein
VKVRKFDRAEVAVYALTFIPLILIGLAIPFWDLSGWVFLPWFVLLLVWLVGYQLWYQRRHPTQAPEAQDAGQ